MKMGEAGIGLDLGVEDFRAVFVFYDRDALQTLQLIPVLITNEVGSPSNA